jgi:hypothetical protein
MLFVVGCWPWKERCIRWKPVRSSPSRSLPLHPGQRVLRASGILRVSGQRCGIAVFLVLNYNLNLHKSRWGPSRTHAACLKSSARVAAAWKPCRGGWLHDLPQARACRLSTNLIIYMTKVMGEDNGFAAIQVSQRPWEALNLPHSCAGFS